MNKEKAVELIARLEMKYLGETRHIPYDKYFRMLYAGMTEHEAKTYSDAKLMLIRNSHGLSSAGGGSD